MTVFPCTCYIYVGQSSSQKGSACQLLTRYASSAVDRASERGVPALSDPVAPPIRDYVDIGGLRFSDIIHLSQLRVGG
uniref:Polyketide synthase n=1 Tax=Peronospora matthiolae TaxID=2874970 RepID=A0AAV1T4X7_9STRA